MIRTRTLVAHCRMRSEGQVERVLERIRQMFVIVTYLQ